MTSLLQTSALLSRLPGRGVDLAATLLVQAAGLAVAWGAGSAASAAAAVTLPAWAYVAGSAVAAGGIATGCRMPVRWCLIHAVLPLLAGLALGADVSPALYLAAFVVAAAVFGLRLRTRVPLFLSSAEAVRALAALLPRGRRCRVADLGCGTGTVLAGLAVERPCAELLGVERAVLPWLASWLRGGRGRRFVVHWGDLWALDLAGFDVVYAFLSPEEMPRLWEKARREMRPGALLVSFRFAVPGVAPEREVPTGADPAARLLVWRMGD